VSSYRVGGIVVESAPPVDPAIARALAAYAEPTSMRLLDVSGDGRTALVIARGDVLEIGAGKIVRRIRGYDVNWAQLDTLGTVVATADDHGDERYQLYRQRSGDDPMLAESGRHADVIVDRARRHLFWATSRSGSVDQDLYIADIDGTGGTPIYTGGGQWSPVAAADGVLLAKQTLSTTSSRLYRVEPDHTVVALTDAGLVGTAVIGPGGEIYATATNGGDHLGIYQITATERIALTPDLVWDVTALALSSDGSTIAFVANQDARSALYLLDTRTHERRQASTVHATGVIADLHFADHADVLGMTWGDARHPRDAYRYDLHTAMFERWYDAPPPAIASETLVEPTQVSIASSDGIHVPTLVYRPHLARAPVIVQFHGGPDDQWLPRWSGFDQFLIARGWALVQPNIRGSSGYGVAFARLDDGPKRAGVIADVGAVLDWIASQPDLDARHVVVMGTSYGGFVAMSAAATYPDRIRGAIDIVGIADLVSFLAGTSSYRQNERRAEYGDERDPEVRERLTRLSPLSRVHDIRVPVLVAHGARDPRVPATGADRLVSAMRAAGQDVWYLRADDEGHGFTRASNRGVLQVIATQFLDHLRVAP
jgi:dipeptidyl aminopeptidase/acylaminoacyl peptidase